MEHRRLISPHRPYAARRTKPPGQLGPTHTGAEHWEANWALYSEGRPSRRVGAAATAAQHEEGHVGLADGPKSSIAKRPQRHGAAYLKKIK
jgi:hypothetical protein